MKPIEKIALDTLLQGIIDFQNSVDAYIFEEVEEFADAYDINDDFGMQDCANKLIETAIKNVAQKFELSESEVYDAIAALEN